MSAIRILEMAQPENDELFPVRKWRGLQEFFKCLEKEDNKSRRRGARVEADNEHGGKDKIDFPHRVFRYRASEPEGHRVICMHVQDAEHAVIKSGDILILDDFERVFIRAVILVADRKSFLHFAACILRLFRWHT